MINKQTKNHKYLGYWAWLLLQTNLSSDYERVGKSNYLLLKKMVAPQRWNIAEISDSKRFFVEADYHLERSWCKKAYQTETIEDPGFKFSLMVQKLWLLMQKTIEKLILLRCGHTRRYQRYHGLRREEISAFLNLAFRKGYPPCGTSEFSNFWLLYSSAGRKPGKIIVQQKVEEWRSCGRCPL